LLDALLGLRHDVAGTDIGLLLDLLTHVLRGLGGPGDVGLGLLARLVQDCLHALLRLRQLALRLLRVLDALADHRRPLIERLREQWEDPTRQHDEHDQEHDDLGDKVIDIDAQGQICNHCEHLPLLSVS